MYITVCSRRQRKLFSLRLLSSIRITALFINIRTVRLNFKPKASLCPGGKGVESHIKRGGMLVVSLRGVNFGFWSHLGCSGQNAIIYSRESLL